jgi:hypothetical protein
LAYSSAACVTAFSFTNRIGSRTICTRAVFLSSVNRTYCTRPVSFSFDMADFAISLHRAGEDSPMLITIADSPDSDVVSTTG